MELWKHRDCGPNQLRQIEQCVQGLIACMHKFDPISPKIWTLQSALPSSSQLVADSNLVHTAGIDKE